MALNLGDFDAYYDPSMTVTIQGKQYTVPPVSAELGLWARRVAAARDDEKLATKIGEPPLPDGMSMEEAMLGAALVAELAADGVPDPTVFHLAQTVFTRMIGGDDLALLFARGEIGPNPQSPANREERRATVRAAKKASASKTTSTAEGATPRKRASGSGTRSPKPSAAKKTASRGGKS